MATFGRLSASQHTRESTPSYCSRDWGSSTEDHMELKILDQKVQSIVKQMDSKAPVCWFLSAWYHIILSVISGRGPVGKLGQ